MITLKGNAGVAGAQGIKGDTGAQGVAGQGFFSWFAAEVGDIDGDNDIDKQDVRLWFAGAAQQALMYQLHQLHQLHQQLPY